MAFGFVWRNYFHGLRANGLLLRNRRALGMPVINKTGSTIAVDKLVAISGYDTTTKLPKIVLADADSANLATDVFVTTLAIKDGKTGNVFKGALSAANLNTSGVTTVGDPVYLDVTAGAFTATAPTAADARIVLVGYAQVKSSTVGQIAWDIQDPQKFGINDSQVLAVSGLVNTTAATLTVTATAHANRIITLNRAGGVASTLPAATGTGNKYTFLVGTTFTSAGTIAVASGTDYMIGTALFDGDDAGNAANGFTTANTGTVATESDTISMDGTTKGGMKGAVVEIWDAATAIFVVQYRSGASGTEATPFSAAV